MIRFVSLTSLFVVAATATACTSVAEDSDQTAAAISGGNAITGRWELATIKSYYDTGFAGSSVAQRHHVESSTLLGRGPVAEFNLDASGRGTITALETCRISIPGKRDDGQLGDIHGTPVALGVVGVLLLLEDVATIAESVKCAGGAREAGTKYAYAVGDSFPANLGVHGENKDPRAADAECHSLKGYRYVTLAGANACVGFRDAAGTALEMLVQAPGEIYLSRMTLRKTTREVEGEAGGATGGRDVACNVGTAKSNASAMKACFVADGGRGCLMDASRYKDAAGHAVPICGLTSGGGYACSYDDLLTCLEGGGGTGCFDPQQGHCFKI